MIRRLTVDFPSQGELEQAVTEGSSLCRFIDLGKSPM